MRLAWKWYSPWVNLYLQNQKGTKENKQCKGSDVNQKLRTKYHHSPQIQDIKHQPEFPSQNMIQTHP
jgi:hypothetical protein